MINLLIAIGAGWASISMMRMAADIAIRRGTSVWHSARPEFGASILLMSLALLVAWTAGASA